MPSRRAGPPADRPGGGPVGVAGWPSLAGLAVGAFALLRGRRARRRRRSPATRCWSRAARSTSTAASVATASRGGATARSPRGLAGPPVGDLTDATWKHGDRARAGPRGGRARASPARPCPAGGGRSAPTASGRSRPMSITSPAATSRAGTLTRRVSRGQASCWTTASASISIRAASSIRRATSTRVVAGRIWPKTSPWASPTSCHLRDVGQVHPGPDHVRRLAAERLDGRQDDLQRPPGLAPDGRRERAVGLDADRPGHGDQRRPRGPPASSRSSAPRPTPSRRTAVPRARSRSRSPSVSWSCLGRSGMRLIRIRTAA